MVGKQKRKSKVALLRCEEYGKSQEALTKALQYIHRLDIFKGKKVLLKINLMAGRTPEQSVNTHPEFVRSMIRIVKTQGGEVLVGDSSGILGFTREAFRASGIEEVVTREGARLVNFDASRIVKKSINGKILHSIYLPEEVLTSDVLVSMPKLKTHPLMLFTGAVKNQLGLLPGGEKCRVHQVAPNLSCLAEALVDINLAVKFDLAAMDGILGLEGGGTNNGRPRKCGLIAASPDLIALDTVCSYAMGMDPSRVITNGIGAARGLGCNNLNEIEILGEDIERCITRFDMPPFDIKRNPLIAKIAYRIRANAITPVVIKEKCNHCGVCKEMCPVNSIALDGAATIDLKSCINCFSCYENCPVGAIKLKCQWYLRWVFKKKAGLKIGGLDRL